MFYLDINLFNFTTNILDFEDLNIKKDIYLNISHYPLKFIIIKCLESSNVPVNINHFVYSIITNYLNILDKLKYTTVNNKLGYIIYLNDLRFNKYLSYFMT